MASLLGDVPIRCSEDSAKYPQDLVYVIWKLIRHKINLVYRRSVRTIQMIKDIHRPFWSSLFTVPDPGKFSNSSRPFFAKFCLF